MAHSFPSTDIGSADQLEQDAQYYRGVLHALIDMGADLARQIHQQADAAPAADAVVAFDRVARTIRRSIALARRIAEPRGRGGQRRAASRRQIIRAVEDEIQRRADGDAAGRLHAEFCERLDGAELDDEIDDERPVEAIIADICRDLGLAGAPGTHPWKRRSPEDVAVLCARARSSGVGGACGGGSSGVAAGADVARGPFCSPVLDQAVPHSGPPPERARARGS